jgi:predicted ester cyclase
VTGNTIAFDGMVFWRVSDGQIAERWAVLDSAVMQRQLQARTPQQDAARN